MIEPLNFVGPVNFAGLWASTLSAPIIRHWRFKTATQEEEKSINWFITSSLCTFIFLDSGMVLRLQRGLRNCEIDVIRSVIDQKASNDLKTATYHPGAQPGRPLCNDPLLVPDKIMRKTNNCQKICW